MRAASLATVLHRGIDEGGAFVPKYLVTVNYTVDGVKGVQAEGASTRVAAVNALIESLGGTRESFYFAMGETDAYITCDMPNPVSGLLRS